MEDPIKKHMILFFVSLCLAYASESEDIAASRMLKIHQAYYNSSSTDSVTASTMMSQLPVSTMVNSGPQPESTTMSGGPSGATHPVSSGTTTVSTQPTTTAAASNQPNRDDPNPYYICTAEGGRGQGQKPFVADSECCDVERPDSFVPENYVPALSASSQVALKAISCTPSAGNICPFYLYPRPNPAPGQQQPTDFLHPSAHVDVPFDDFSGISYKQLNLAAESFGVLAAAAANSVGAPASDGGIVYGRQTFYTWWLWFPEAVAVVIRGANLPAYATFTSVGINKVLNGVVNNFVNQFTAVVSNDSTKFLAIADDLAGFHHILQKNRILVQKHHHFRTLRRAFIAAAAFFLGDAFTADRRSAVDEVFDFIFRFNSFFLIEYDIKCKRLVHQEDFIRDPPQNPPGSSSGSPATTTPLSIATNAMQSGGTDSTPSISGFPSSTVAGGSTMSSVGSPAGMTPAYAPAAPGVAVM